MNIYFRLYIPIDFKKQNLISLLRVAEASVIMISWKLKGLCALRNTFRQA